MGKVFDEITSAGAAMNTELAFNAYIFLGNALNLIANATGLDNQAALGVPKEAIANLYARLEPLKPNEILAALQTLSTEETDLLFRCCHLCLTQMSDDELESKMGLTRHSAEEVIHILTPTTDPSFRPEA